MSRTKYRHRIMILRRKEDGNASKGGYAADTYEKICETSCSVLDETEAEWATAESAKVEHVRTFDMRLRDIRSDDLIVWRGETYRVRRRDGVKNLGREIRVRAALSTSRYTITM